MASFRVQFEITAQCTEYLEAHDMREAVKRLQNNYLEGIPFGEYDSLEGYQIEVRSIDLYTRNLSSLRSVSGEGSDMEEQFTKYYAPEGAMYVEEIE